jgi:AcrR family transcriptional regulator
MTDAPAAEAARPVRRSRAKHAAILDAAARVVAERGYPAATVEAVAAAAGVGKQTIYRWWPSKAALFVEVYARLADRAALSGDAGAGTAEDRLARFLRRLFRLYRETPAGAVLAGLVGEAAADAATRDAIETSLYAGRSDLVPALVTGAAARPEIVNEVVVAMVWRRLAIRPASLDDAFARDLAAIALGAGGRP